MDNKRAKNFTDYDKNILFEIVQKFRHIVENKKPTPQMLKRKMILGIKFAMSIMPIVKAKYLNTSKISSSEDSEELEYITLFLLYFTTNTK